MGIVIPNSKINAASILNYSYGEIQRSCLFRFPIGYESDIEKTKIVIYDAVKGSPYTIPGKRQKDGSVDYGDIYFIELADSALLWLSLYIMKQILQAKGLRTISIPVYLNHLRKTVLRFLTITCLL